MSGIEARSLVAMAALAVCVAIASVQVTALPAQAFSPRVSPSAVDVAAAYMSAHPGADVLADEAGAMALFGGARAIWIEPAGE